MKNQQTNKTTLKMVADHMEGGLLENIIDMFKHDKSLYPMIGDMIGDIRSRVRIGTIALVETLKEDHPEDIRTTIPGIAKLLKNSDPTIRGDAAYLLAIIGHKDALPFLSAAIDDKHALVKETIEESIKQISDLSSP